MRDRWIGLLSNKWMEVIIDCHVLQRFTIQEKRCDRKWESGEVSDKLGGQKF